ncbi:hypothetical protein B0T18DRAFT_385150 [Schizothecium vesticola]|uniref:Fungal N-terminal domain-containing protein n=1 Tax=Schizothecium vesticola TaxID=314040 RepID=A0AA40KBG0_9PEZI|nr:hypothetical protein B0T18DRAFT_385150 [Schizothecium vesticola]
MAEALGIASGIAGFASLLIEIIKGLVVLKERAVAIKQLPETVATIEESLISLEHIRRKLETKLAQQPGDYADEALLQVCVKKCDAIARSVTALESRLKSCRKRDKIFHGITDASMVREVESIKDLTLEASQWFTLLIFTYTPAAAIGEFVTGAAGYSLRTALQIQRLVKATSKGFEILHRLRYFNTTMEEAKTAFKRLHASDPALNTHVNFEIIRFLVEELGVRNGMETPQFELWPEPAVSLLAPPERYGGYIMPEVDPFYVEAIALIASKSPGQTAFHMALHPSRANALKVLLDEAPELKDQTDRWGFPPLMYAAAMGYQDAAASLIQNNASLTLPTDENILGIHLPDYGDFIGCCLASGHSGMIWELYDDLLTNATCSDYPLWPRLSALLETLQAPENDKEQRDWEQTFWDLILSDLGPEDLNFSFGKTGKNIAHLVPSDAEVKGLIKRGFRDFNTPDHNGEHCLFTLSRSRLRSSKAMAELLVAGADPIFRNPKGRTAVHLVLESLGLHAFGMYDTVEAFARFQVLLGTAPTTSCPPLLSGDSCDCPCSDGGCLPTDSLFPIFGRPNAVCLKNILWLFEVFVIFSDIGRHDWIRTSILSLLRRFEFEEMGIQHCCMCHGKDVEKRFWDTFEEERRIEKLEQKMRTLQDYDDEQLEQSLFEKIRVSLGHMAETFKLEQEKRKAREREWSRTPLGPPPGERSTSIIDHTNDTFIDPSEELINRIVFLESGLLDKPGQRMFRDYSTPWDMIAEYIAYLKLTGLPESKKFRTEPGYLKSESDLERRRRFNM